MCELDDKNKSSGCNMNCRLSRIGAIIFLLKIFEFDRVLEAPVSTSHMKGNGQERFLLEK
jgi:hypothetical protein